jgi:hypothetical protein
LFGIQIAFEGFYFGFVWGVSQFSFFSFFFFSFLFLVREIGTQRVGRRKEGGFDV